MDKEYKVSKKVQLELLETNLELINDINNVKPELIKKAKETQAKIDKAYWENREYYNELWRRQQDIKAKYRKKRFNKKGGK